MAVESNSVSCYPICLFHSSNYRLVELDDTTKLEGNNYLNVF